MSRNSRRLRKNLLRKTKKKTKMASFSLLQHCSTKQRRIRHILLLVMLCGVCFLGAGRNFLLSLDLHAYSVKDDAESFFVLPTTTTMTNKILQTNETTTTTTTIVDGGVYDNDNNNNNNNNKSSFSKVLVLMIDDRYDMKNFTTGGYHFYSLMINIMWAQKYKYVDIIAAQMTSEHCYLDGIQDPVNINWCKIIIANYYHNNHDDNDRYEWILVLDSDAMLSYFNPMSFYDLLSNAQQQQQQQRREQKEDYENFGYNNNNINIIFGEDHPGWQVYQVNRMLIADLKDVDMNDAINKSKHTSLSSPPPPPSSCTVLKYIHDQSKRFNHTEFDTFYSTTMKSNNIPILVINAGTFFIRRQQQNKRRYHRNQRPTKGILDDWLSVLPSNYNRSNWLIRNWLTKWPAEQAVFNCFLLNSDLPYVSGIHVVDYQSKLLNIGNQIYNESFVNHITNAFENARINKIPKYFQSVLVKYYHEQQEQQNNHHSSGGGIMKINITTQQEEFESLNGPSSIRDIENNMKQLFYYYFQNNNGNTNTNNENNENYDGSNNNQLFHYKKTINKRASDRLVFNEHKITFL